MSSSQKLDSIIKAANILRCLAKGINRIRDISNELQLNKSTVYRILKSLEIAGMVAKDPSTRSYFLGMSFLELAAQPMIAHQNLVNCAVDEMKRLRDLSQETVLIHIQNGVERICLNEIQSFSPIKYTGGKGMSVPIYTGSAGKILLSKLPDKELRDLLENLTFLPITPSTITDKDILLREVIEARDKGYAMSFGERTVGSASISVPINNYACSVALSILGPESRFASNMMGLLDELRVSAERITKRIQKVYNMLDQSCK